MRFLVRAFVANPGGAYNPAPLEQFDSDGEVPISEVPHVGDVLRHGVEAFRVKARFFDFAGQQCSLDVEQTEAAFPQD